jgi:hypothetical protein
MWSHVPSVAPSVPQYMSCLYILGDCQYSIPDSALDFIYGLANLTHMQKETSVLEVHLYQISV